MWRTLRKLAHDVEGAVAPTLALSITALIAAGGIAFDYARLASMDTELQNAADQAALAAATQLDGEVGARDRATAAAQNLVANVTRFANDGGGAAVDVPAAQVTFYSDYDRATGDKTPAAGDEDAGFVLVTVETRTANYALTPIVAAISSNVTASAFAGMDSAWCNLPPFMVCAPLPAEAFDPDDHIGAGLHMVIGSPNTPGNFGFLQTGFGSGAENLAKAIGWNGSAGGCVAARGVVTEPGDKVSVRAAVNTRFDMSDSGQTCPAGGTCSPSTNARKDLVHGNTCGSSGNQGWSEIANPYRRPDGTSLPAGQEPAIMGHPPDLCHMAQPNGCGIVGNGNWDRDAYFRANYGWNDEATWTVNTGLAANATRYQVYLWEAANPTPPGTTGGIGRRQGPFLVPNGQGQGTTSKFSDDVPVCRPPGIEPFDPTQDRRRTSVAVVRCTGANPNGRDVVRPLAWMDVFLVEPSHRRTGRTTGDEVYAEIIAKRELPGIGQTLNGVVRRDVPRLIE